MSSPDFQTVMLPLLELLADEKEHSLRETMESLAESFGLSETELKELLPSGQQSVFSNRVGWARTYLKKAGLIESTRRGFFKIAPRGLDVLRQKPEAINVKFLYQYPEFQEFRRGGGDKLAAEAKAQNEEPITALESIEEGYQQIRKELAEELLARVLEGSPEDFERLVVDLLIAMGYGGSREDAGKAVGEVAGVRWTGFPDP